MIKALKLSLLLLCLPLAAWANDFKAGTHYEVLGVDASEQDKVTEFFSFYCPHCYKLEPIVLALEEALPEGVALEKNHVNFLRLPVEVQDSLTSAYLVAKEQGIEHEVAAAIFKSIHIQREPLQSEQALEALLAEQGIAAQQYVMLSASSEVVDGTKAAIAKQEKYSKMGALTGVPTLIVNDKYKIMMQGISSQEQLNELVNYLLEK